MRRIAVINQKGGVGKTTTTANLAAALTRAGHRVLLIDLDPQAHLSLHFGTELRDGEPGLYDVLTSATPIGDVAIKVCDRTTLVPADIDLAGVEAELVSVTGREVILREAVDQMDSDHDVMLIDCPPSLGVLTINALVAAGEVLIPLQAQFFALQGLSKLLNTVTLVRRRINPVLRVAGIVLCMHDATTRLAGEVVDDLSLFLDGARGTDVPWAQASIYKTRVRRNIKLAEACSFGKTIFDYAPRSNGAADYAALAQDVFPELIHPEPPVRDEASRVSHETRDPRAALDVPIATTGVASEVPVDPPLTPDSPTMEPVVTNAGLPDKTPLAPAEAPVAGRNDALRESRKNSATTSA